METTKKTMIRQIQRLLAEVGIKKIYFGQKAPEIPLPRDMVTWPRVLVCLSGEMELMYTSMSGVIQKKFTAGEILFLPAFCCTRSIWSSSHEQLSAVLRDEWLRVLYIDHKGGVGDSDLRPAPNAYFHVKKYHPAIPGIFTALSELYSQNDAEIAISLTELLFKLFLKDIKSFQHDEPAPLVKCPMWPWILEYVHDNITNYKLDRDSIAREFNLSPQYISRLFHKNAGRTLNNYINGERLLNAEKLLKTTNMLIKEIAWECGYPHTSYFIKTFRKYYGITPASYRRKARKLKLDSVSE